MLYHYLLDGQGLDQKVVADLVLENTLRLKKADIMPERNYQNLVDRIAKWLDCWLSCAIPSPSELISEKEQRHQHELSLQEIIKN